jgi:hypothetical protein
MKAMEITKHGKEGKAWEEKESKVRFSIEQHVKNQR